MKNRLIHLALVALCFSFTASALDRDLSADLVKARLDGVEADRLIERLHPYDVVFVPGFLSNLQGTPQYILRNFIAVNTHFEEQIVWLKANGVEARRLTLRSQATPEANSAAIAAELEKATKPVFLVTHSKGGVDSLHAFVNRKDLLKKVVAWVAFQTPFRGTPIADAVFKRGYLRTLALPLLEWGDGDREMLQALTTTATTQYLEDHRADVEEIVRGIPMLSFLSTKPDVPGYDTSLEVLRNLLWRNGYPNDGIIPESSAVLPGSDFMRVEGMDHGAIISNHGRFQFPRVQFTQQVLSVFLQANASI
jgi:hypothetical protein